MANEDSVLKEVDHELAEERQWLMFRKYGPAFIGASAALIVAVGAWQVYDSARTSASNKHAEAFSNAAELLINDEEQGRAALAAIANDANSGYALLSQFRRAASFAESGSRTEAIETFTAIYNNGGAPKPLRKLARIRAGYLALPDGRDASFSHIGAMAREGGPYSPYANEIEGIGALKAEDYETALSIFTALISDPETPPALMQRAEEFRALALSGKGGVNLAGKITLDDLAGVVGADGTPAPGEDNHEHHNDENHADDESSNQASIGEVDANAVENAATSTVDDGEETPETDNGNEE